MANELKPDSVKMDLSLAEKYVKENEKLWTEPLGAIIPGKAETEEGYIKLKFLDLAEQINDNSVLFSQLEYMRREVHPNDVINWDIKLLVQYLTYSASARTVKLEDPTGRSFTEGTPLANLGFFILDLRMSPRILMICDHKSAPVCTLFTQLCHKVGLNTIELELMQSDASVYSGPEATARCTGVITESADIDSAIDVFLGSTTKYPWKLANIYVQESIYERFQTVMTSKCEVQHKSGDQTDNCKSFSYKDKTFLIDYLGDYKQIEKTTYMTVEAYRTTKELMALLKNHYVSLWCNDISQANEIAFNINAKAVWINDYALFKGPPESSLVYYKIYLQNYYTQKLGNENVNEDLWLKKLRECFKIFINESNTEDNRKFIDDALLSLTERNQKVHVDEKGTLCVVDLKPSGIPVTGMNTMNWMYIAQDMLYYVKEGITDVGWDVGTKIENVDVGKLFNVLEGKQVPVTFIESGMKSQFIVDFYNVKAIWTTFGTVFAN